MQQRCSNIEQATQFQQLVVVMSRTDASADGPRPRRLNNSGGPATGRYRKKMEGLLSFS